MICILSRQCQAPGDRVQTLHRPRPEHLDHLGKTSSAHLYPRIRFVPGKSRRSSSQEAPDEFSYDSLSQAIALMFASMSKTPTGEPCSQPHVFPQHLNSRIRGSLQTLVFRKRRMHGFSRAQDCRRVEQHRSRVACAYLPRYPVKLSPALPSGVRLEVALSSTRDCSHCLLYVYKELFEWNDALPSDPYLVSPPV